ncbi:MAG: hypothetical protein WBA87_07770 [Microbacterium sp.]
MFSVGTGDLASGLSQILLGLVVLGLVASVVGIRAKKAGSASVTLDISATLAFGWLVLCALFSLFVIWQTFFVSTVTITADVQLNDLPDFEWDAAGKSLPALLGAYGNGLGLEITGLPIGIRLVLLAGQLLMLALFALPAWVIRVVTVSAQAGTPFAPRVAKTLGIAAIMVLVMGIAHDLVVPIGQTLAAAAVLPEDGGPLTASRVFSLTVQIWPFAAALGLAALAAVFRHGHRLQRETEGLV